MIKKILVISQLDKKEFDISKKIFDIYPHSDFDFIFYDKGEEVFLKDGNRVENIYESFLFKDIVINFLDIDLKISKEISQKIKLLKIKTIQNSLENRIIFSSKKNQNDILKKYNFQVPAYQNLESFNPSEIFSNFATPFKILSKKKDYFSEIIENFSDIEQEIKKIPQEKNDYFLKEILDGEVVYSFVYKKEQEIFTYLLSKNEIEKKEEFIKISKYFFEKVGMEKFCLIFFRNNPKRGIFFEEIFCELNILDEKNREILDKILEKEGKNISDIF